MKQENKDVKTKNPFAVAAVIALIIAVLLLIVLADMCFVPSGTIWEDIKADYVQVFHPDESPTDSEIWQEINADISTNADTFPSKIYRWLWLKSMWYEEREQDRLREEKIVASNLAAEEIKTAFEEYLSENEIKDFTEADIFSMHKGHINIALYSNGDCRLFEDEKLIQRINEITADWDRYSAKAIIRDNKCTAAAFAPEINRDIVIGSDCPYINSEGGFDYERLWGYDSALAQNGYILGLAPQQEGLSS